MLGEHCDSVINSKIFHQEITEIQLLHTDTISYLNCKKKKKNRTDCFWSLESSSKEVLLRTS